MAFAAGFEDHLRVLATIALVDGDAAELNSLYAWLQRDDEFRGRVEAVPARSEPGEMGGVTEMLTVAVGSGGAGAVLAGTLSAWVSSRRAKISVDLVIGDKTRRIEIDAANATTAAQLFRTAVETANETS
jgi:hypothetical protein